MNKNRENYIKSVIHQFNKVDRIFALTCVYHFSYEDAERIAKEMVDEEG